MAPHSSTLAWKIPWTKEPGRLQSMGSLRVGHDWATSLSLFTFLHWRRTWQPTPVFLPGESQGRGAWWAAIYVVAQSRTWLKRLSSSSSSSSRALYICPEILTPRLCIVKLTKVPKSGFVHQAKCLWKDHGKLQVVPLPPPVVYTRVWSTATLSLWSNTNSSICTRVNVAIQQSQKPLLQKLLGAKRTGLSWPWTPVLILLLLQLFNVETSQLETV